MRVKYFNEVKLTEIRYYSKFVRFIIRDKRRDDFEVFTEIYIFMVHKNCIIFLVKD